MFAAFAQGSLIRLIPVGMVMLALQRTVFVDIKVAGVTVQVVLALAAAAGASGGSERGAVAGFVLGAMFDLVEGTPAWFNGDSVHYRGSSCGAVGRDHRRTAVVAEGAFRWPWVCCRRGAATGCPCFYRRGESLAGEHAHGHPGRGSGGCLDVAGFGAPQSLVSEDSWPRMDGTGRATADLTWFRLCHAATVGA